jgi:hypothetical protein
VATMGQIEINCVDMFRSSPSPDREAGVGFASPSLLSVATWARVLGATKALSGDNRQLGPLSSPISGLSTVVAMGQIKINWDEMFHNSPSPDCGSTSASPAPLRCHQRRGRERWAPRRRYWATSDNGVPRQPPMEEVLSA